MTDQVVLKVSGKAYGGWSEVEVTRSMESISGSFSLILSDHWSGVSDYSGLGNSNINASQATIGPGDTCEVYIGSDLVISGYPYEPKWTLDANNHGMVLAGRDRSGDLVDCSAVNTPGQWKNQSLESLVGLLVNPFGISVSAPIPSNTIFDDFTIEPGESVFEAIQRLCRMAGFLAIADRKGNIILTQSSQAQAAASIVEGQNLLSGEHSVDSKDWFSEITVKGQTASSNLVNGLAATGPNATVYDDTVPRYRPLFIRVEGQANTTQCLRRAEWEQATRIAKAEKTHLTVQGWRQSPNGPLWDINLLAKVQSPRLNVNDVFLISSVTYRQNDQGTLTEMELCPSDAFLVDPEETKNHHKSRINLV